MAHLNDAQIVERTHNTARFFVEFVRIEPIVAFGLTSAQVTGLVLVPLGTALVLAPRRWQTAAA